MVTTYGQWIEEKDYNTYPLEKWCDYDRAANYIRNVLHYEPKTTMENLITMLFLQGEDDIFDDMGCLNERQMEDYIEGNGISEFDYHC